MTNYIELSDITTLVNGAEADEKKMVADSAGSLLKAVIDFTNSSSSTPEEKVWFSGTLTETLRTATRDGARAIDTGATTPPASQQGLGASKPVPALNGGDNSNSDAAAAEIAELKKQLDALAELSQAFADHFSGRNQEVQFNVDGSINIDATLQAVEAAGKEQAKAIRDLTKERDLAAASASELTAKIEALKAELETEKRKTLPVGTVNLSAEELNKLGSFMEEQLEGSSTTFGGKWVIPENQKNTLLDLAEKLQSSDAESAIKAL